jgi:hypothetical protein
MHDMKKVILFKGDLRLPTTISEVTDPANSLYEDKQVLPTGDIIRILDTVDSNSTIFETYHINGFEVEQHLPKNDDYQEWSVENLQWQDIPNKIALLQSVKKELINNSSNIKILYRYPYYYQLNAPYDFGQDSAEVITMRTWIDGIRAKANLAKAQLETLSLEFEMDLVVKNFEKELGDIA